MIGIQPLLSITIPTWNRASFLEGTLAQLHHELQNVPAGGVEILVSDNCSQDNTQAVVEQALQSGLPLTYIRNSENIGSDANIAQCFNLAQGTYVLILGDDDLLVDGSLELLLGRLASNQYGVVCLRPYGFESDFRKECPGVGGAEKVFENSGNFLAEIGSLITLISSCVINKSCIGPLDANQFCGGNLVQVHLVIRAALNMPRNLFIKKYLVACKRNNSGGYDFSRVFVKELGDILDKYREMGLSSQAISLIEQRLIIGYYPFYLFRQRITNTGNLAETFITFHNRFCGRLLFYIWLAPIIKLPRACAIVWGACIIMVGRSMTGDFKRGVSFAVNRLLCVNGLKHR